MRVGSNLPYEGMNSVDVLRCQDQLDRMRANEVLVMSHIPEAQLKDIVYYVRPGIVHVRAKTGPSNQGLYPGYILDYAEWPGERTLRDTIVLLNSLGYNPHVILGNEPDIEMAQRPEDSSWWQFEAETYRQWYETEVVNIRAAFRDAVSISPAPLSQGWHDRFMTWYNVLYPTYQSKYTDFIAEHLYLGDNANAEEWHQRFVYYAPFGKEIHVTEFNDNGLGRTPTLYREACGWYETAGIAALSFFTLEGGTNTQANRPAWWFITEEEAEQIGLRDQEVEEPSVMNIYDAFIQLWQANGPVTYWIGEDYSGIFKAWTRNPREYGSPLADEFTTDDGRTVQAFATGVYEWKDGGLVRVESGL